MIKRILQFGLIAALVAALTGWVYWYDYQHPEIQVSDVVIEFGDEDWESEVQDATGGLTWECVELESGQKLGSFTATVYDRMSSEEFTITITDTTAPEITVDTDKIEINEGDTLEESDILSHFTYTDEGECTAELTYPAEYSTDDPGDYTLTYAVTDGSGNESSASILITVKEVVKEVVTEAPYAASGTEYGYEGYTEGYTEEYTAEYAGDTAVYGNVLSIPAVGIYAYISVGSSQYAIDSSDVCLFDTAYTPGQGGPILMAGHNTSSLGSLPGVYVGSVITVYWGGYAYNYSVYYSHECTTDDYWLYDTETQENMLQYSGSEVLQIYTCYGNNRWMVKAYPC